MALLTSAPLHKPRLSVQSRLWRSDVHPRRLGLWTVSLPVNNRVDCAVATLHRLSIHRVKVRQRGFDGGELAIFVIDAADSHPHTQRVVCIY